MTRQVFQFVGVSTAGSSIMGLFPRWAVLLGVDAAIEGYDLPLDATPVQYRQAVAGIVARPEVRGGLVTTHKVGVFQHARDLFDRLDGYAVACEEVSCLAKRDGALVGYAKDPVTAGRSLDEMLAPDHFATSGAQVLCLGAGGAGVAITLCLLSRDPPPARIVLTDRDPRRLDAARRCHATLGAAAGGVTPGTTPVDYLEATGPADPLVAALTPGSLVINATGMGKDRPGSPLSDRVRFPAGGLVWDLNYRGDLLFLDQARARAAHEGLAVHDGWRYFLHGWAEHLAEVFQVDVTPDRFAALAEAAELARPAQAGPQAPQ
jgi:shikimate 5-dehydrogenase